MTWRMSIGQHIRRSCKFIQIKQYKTDSLGLIHSVYCHRNKLEMPAKVSKESVGKPVEKDGVTKPVGDKKKRQKARKESYNIYINKVLKQIYPEFGISRSAMSIMDSMSNFIFENVAKHAAELAKKANKQTIGQREMQSACKLVFHGELTKHSISEGAKAINRYEKKEMSTSQSSLS